MLFDCQLAVRGTVFARFSPEQKQQLIEALQGVEYVRHLRDLIEH